MKFGIVDHLDCTHIFTMSKPYFEGVLPSSSEGQLDSIDSDEGLALFFVRELEIPVLAPDLY